ncbi:MAG: DDE-type integrase/transposase/recombinase [bacterium]|nr:DDE-type integrase/transposase/recombinase [bacterium]MBK8168702.1 DDE-type integrase/transposase/recombinase [bacterium]
MAALAKLYGQYRKRLSIKGFMRVVGPPCWRLRDYWQGGVRREQRGQLQSRAVTAILGVAGAQPTYGYRRAYHRLRQQRAGIGRERVRRLLGVLGLQPPLPMKKKRPAAAVVAQQDWPEGRRLQIDATRFRLDDGVAWVYLVEAVKTRHCVAASAAPSLSQARAANTLLDGHRRLSALELPGPRLIQSDAGSDFTSGHFQQVCRTIGQWVRCRVAQVGGMGILERLNRTFKHEFVFRHEVNTLADLKSLSSRATGFEGRIIRRGGFEVV